MFETLCELHHFPSRPENSFVALGLPELDIELTAGEPSLDKPGLPFWFLGAVHHSNSNCTNRRLTRGAGLRSGPPSPRGARGCSRPRDRRRPATSGTLTNVAGSVAPTP